VVDELVVDDGVVVVVVVLVEVVVDEVVVVVGALRNRPPTEVTAFEPCWPTAVENDSPATISITVTTPNEMPKTKATAARIDQCRPTLGRGPVSGGGNGAAGWMTSGETSLERTPDAVGASLEYPVGGGTYLVVSGAFVINSWTLRCPSSSDLKTAADPIVAAAEPNATPTMVPAAPRKDRARAARTAPETEANTCFQLRVIAVRSPTHQWRPKTALLLWSESRATLPCLTTTF